MREYALFYVKYLKMKDMREYALLYVKMEGYARVCAGMREYALLYVKYLKMKGMRKYALLYVNQLTRYDVYRRHDNLLPFAVK